MTSPPLLKLGTRGSRLALIQAGLVRDALAAAVPALAASGAIEIVAMKTTGDAIQDRPLTEAGGKGLFVKEIEEALLDGRIDIAVHSMKDMPTAQPAGLVIAAFLPREDARDVLIAGTVRRIAGLAQGAIVGTSALRRSAQLLHLRPDLEVVSIRGNVETRLRKLEAGRCRGNVAGAGRAEAAGHGHGRHADSRRRDAASGRPGRGLHRMPRQQRAGAALAGGNRPWRKRRHACAPNMRCWPCSMDPAARRSPATPC